MGRGAFLVLVGHPFSDGITINIPYGVDIGLVEFKPDFIVRLVETDLEEDER